MAYRRAKVVDNEGVSGLQITAPTPAFGYRQFDFTLFFTSVIAVLSDDDFGIAVIGDIIPYFADGFITIARRGDEDFLRDRSQKKSPESRVKWRFFGLSNKYLEGIKPVDIISTPPRGTPKNESPFNGR